MFEDPRCKDCISYAGDCGRHYKDQFGHINYEIPAEYACDRYGICTSYRAKTSEFQIALDNLKEHEAEMKNYIDTSVLRKALEFTIKEGKI